MSELSFYYNTIYVIESLPAEDRKTGAELYEQTIKPYVSRQKGLVCSYRSVFSKQQFFDTLDSIVNECFQKNRGPLLHFECHGSEDAICTASDEDITWEELKPYLLKLNAQCGLNLLVVLAACNGFNLFKVLSPLERAPLWGVIGPETEMYDDDLLKDYISFYTELILTLDGGKALGKLNVSKPTGDGRYLFYNAEWFFKQIFETYLANACHEDALKKREDLMIEKIAEHRTVSTAEEQVIRTDLKKGLRDYESLFDQFKEHFFFIDKIPENGRRFKIKYSDIQQQVV